MAKILFVHQNFPGQFKHLAPALAERGHEVAAILMKKVEFENWQGVRLYPYGVSRGSTPGVHPWISDFETKVIRAEAAFQVFRKIRDSGFIPDLIIAHPGWGESLFVKEVFQKSKLAIYCEFFYHAEGADVGFDPEFPVEDPEAERCRIKLKNLNNLLHFPISDAALSPTNWQASTYPEEFRGKITVIHDGIDTDLVKPDENTSVLISTASGIEIKLTRQSEVITFVNRNLEPYRGYHIFMRALPEILRRRPKARVLIVGGNQVSYGKAPDPQKYGGLTSWRDIFIREVRPFISDSDWERVHFLGVIPYNHFLSVLQISTVHVYLTYPFVLSWSLLEAMSAGCAVVGSDTPPVREVIFKNQTGRLVNFFDPKELAEEVINLLEDNSERARLGKNARAFVRENYDLKRVCLPKLLDWVESLL